MKAYRIDLKQFLSFTDGATVGLELLNRYVKHLNQNYAPRSVKRKLASLRAFFNKLELNEAISENPFGKLHVRLQIPRQLPRIIPEQLVRKVLQSAYDAYEPERREVLRDIVILELLFSAGLRMSELCALSKDCFQLGQEILQLLINGVDVGREQWKLSAVRRRISEPQKVTPHR